MVDSLAIEFRNFKRSCLQDISGIFVKAVVYRCLDTPTYPIIYVFLCSFDYPIHVTRVGGELPRVSSVFGVLVSRYAEECISLVLSYGCG